MPACSQCSATFAEQTTLSSLLCPSCSAVDPIHAVSAADDLEADFENEPARLATAPRFEPGQLLAERYRIASDLGRGGMGEVYRADDLKLDETVALKFLPRGIDRDPRRLDMLLAEVRLARSVSHANVCRVHDVGLHEGDGAEPVHFVSMEYLAGEDLASLMRRIGRLPRSKALGTARELCAGLTAVHACGLLHRDIKPSNVLLDSAGRVRLADFGLAVDGQAAFGCAGTPAYLSPEQHTSHEATVRSDIYALGLVLYEIFTGQRAFNASTPREYAWRHLQYQPEAPSGLVEDLHPEIERIILSCLEKIPERRPSSAEAVGEALERVESSTSGAHDSLEHGEILRALLVCDLVGSTALAERLGNRRAAELGARHDRLARDLLVAHAGREIDKTDGFLLLFERSIQALGFALDYHAALERLSSEEGFLLEARVGIHFGELWLRENPPADVRRGAKPIDVDGVAKAIAARVMSLAEGRQTLLTSAAFDLARRATVGFEDLMDDTGQLRWLDHGAWRLHGVADPIDIYEVGRENKAPLAAPEESEKVRRLLIQPRIEGWRPAPGLSVPERPHWRVEKRLGEGGFGETWLVRHDKTQEPRCFKFCFDAERLRALQREITLFRLIKEELGERADISRILDWNLDSAPFFIESEYTSAGDLTHWARSQGGLDEVPMEARLEIVAQIADALAAAHSIGVLHKDVKPSNILIRKRPDGSIQAQLADFGVGQVTEKERLAAAGITVLGLSRQTKGTTSSQTGTPLYLAPELLEGGVPTLQSDIYALGVLLYQAVVGDLRRALAPGWRRDLDNELLTTDIATFVDRTPKRRPASAHEMANCLRSLDKRQQEFRSAEAARVALEASKRRRAAYKAIAVTALISLVTVSTLAIWALQASQKERRARESMEKILGFMVGMFEFADPYRLDNDTGAAITIRELIDTSAKRIGVEFADDSLVQIRLMISLGGIYQSLGLYEKAKSIHEQALTLGQARLGLRHPDTISAKHGLARALMTLGNYQQGSELARQALVSREQLLGREHPATSVAMANLANSFQALGEYEKARDLREEILEIRTKVLGKEHPDTLSAMANLANSLHALGGREHYETARILRENTLEINWRTLGEEHPKTLRSMASVAKSLRMLGATAKARTLDEKTLQLRTKVLGKEHPETLIAMANLAKSLESSREYEQAVKLLEDTVEIQTRVLGEEHPHTLTMTSHLANILMRLEEYEKAAFLQEKILETQSKVLGKEHPSTLATMLFLAKSLSALEERKKARTLHEESLAALSRALGKEHHYTLQAMTSMASSLWTAGEFAEAKTLQKEALELHQRVTGLEHPDTLLAKSVLAGYLRGLGEYSQAKTLGERALRATTQILGSEDPITLKSKSILAHTLLTQGEHSQAIEALKSCLFHQERVLGVEHRDVLWTQHLHARALARQGSLMEAEELQALVAGRAAEKFGTRGSLTLSSTKSLGEIVFLKGDYGRAKRILSQAHDTHRLALAEDHPATLDVKIHLAASLLKLGQSNEARNLAIEAQESLELKLGPRHLLTSQANQVLLAIAIGEGDSVAIARWMEKLRWLAETCERDLEAAKHREIRRYVLEFMDEPEQDTRASSSKQAQLLSLGDRLGFGRPALTAA